jgi:excisionase family DNA binding protein
MTDPLPRLVSIDELAAALGTSPRHVRRLVAERRVPYVKVGRWVRFDTATVTEWLEHHRVDSAR